MTNDTPELGGGQIWKQERFPYCNCYITLLGPDDDGPSQMAMLSDPREQGSCVSTTLLGHPLPPEGLPPVRWKWTADDGFSPAPEAAYVCTAAGSSSK